MHLASKHGNKLFELFETGKLKVAVDPTKFEGLASVADAVDFLYQSKNVGKVVVTINSKALVPTSKL